MNQEAKVEVPLEEDPRNTTTSGVVVGVMPVVTNSAEQANQEEDFLEGKAACSLDGEGACESCQ